MSEARCPGCGGEFAVGGAYHTHVENCERVEDLQERGGVDVDLIDRLEGIERRLLRLESAFMEIQDGNGDLHEWQNREIAALWRRVAELGDAADKAAYHAGVGGMDYESDPFRGPNTPPDYPEIEIETGGEES